MKRKITVEEHHHPTPTDMIMYPKVRRSNVVISEVVEPKANLSYTTCSIFLHFKAFGRRLRLGAYVLARSVERLDGPLSTTT